jgi:hypothetical protein
MGNEVFSIAVGEALLGSVSFELKSLLGIVVENSLEALDSGVEGGIEELGPPYQFKEGFETSKLYKYCFSIARRAGQT